MVGTSPSQGGEIVKSAANFRHSRKLHRKWSKKTTTASNRATTNSRLFYLTKKIHPSQTNNFIPLMR